MRVKHVLALMMIAAVCLLAAESPYVTAKKLFDDGNYKEAYELYKSILLGDAVRDEAYSQAVRSCVSAMQQCGKIAEVDELLESILTTKCNWRAAKAVAACYGIFPLPHYGCLRNNRFQRGIVLGERIGTSERDRIRALQILMVNLPSMEAEAKENDRAEFWLTIAQLLMQRQKGKLQLLSNLSELPDYSREDEYYRYDNSKAKFLPVMPESWDAAKNDGERWRWALKQADCSPEGHFKAQLQFADYVRGCFPRNYYNRDSFGMSSPAFDELLENLPEDEYLDAEGNRVKAPKEFSYFHILFSLYDFSLEHKLNVQVVLERIVGAYWERKQYTKALEWIRKMPDEKQRKHYEESITGAYVAFELDGTLLYDDGPSSLPRKPDDGPSSLPPGASSNNRVKLVYRNAEKIFCTARRFDIRRFYEDYCSRIFDPKAKPDKYSMGARHIDLDLSMVLNNLVQKAKHEAFMQEGETTWEQSLEPVKNYHNGEAFLGFPKLKPGFYLVEGTVPQGNVARTVVCVEAVKLVHKMYRDGHFWQLLDAVTGKPLPNQEIEILTWGTGELLPKKREKQEDNWFVGGAPKEQKDEGMVDDVPGQRRKLFWKKLTRKTDGDGFAFVKREECLLKKEDRLAYDVHFLSFLAFVSIADRGELFLSSGGNVFNRDADNQSNRQVGYVVTDRPVYRPGDVVHLKAWSTYVSYNDQEKLPEVEGKEQRIHIYPPEGDVLQFEDLKRDKYGAVELEWRIPDDAKLGRYSVSLGGMRLVTFQVEEYKKPEVEVTVEVPKEPCQPGERLPVTVKAEYYFGGGVADGEVDVTVRRSMYYFRWNPPWRWGWLYGYDHWWPCGAYSWYPGWRKWAWGCNWHYGGNSTGEVVYRTKGRLDANGRYSFVFDTQDAVRLYGDGDCQYVVTAEVRDSSRRTVVGEGSVLVLKTPFDVHVWGERGFYWAGKSADFKCSVDRCDGKPFVGKGEACLYAIDYPDGGKPVERLVESRPLPLEGTECTLSFAALKAGQYRLSCEVTDDKGRTKEGACIFNVLEAGKTLDKCRFNSLELIPEKREYAPGETLRLLVNTMRPDSTVMLFVRCENSWAPYPRVLHLTGKSTLVDIPVLPSDYPNFIIDAYMVANGELFHHRQSIAVPPASKVLTVEVASPRQVKPGEECEMEIRVTDANGKPMQGELAVSVYDRSLQYIAGNRENRKIEDVFWKWIRSYYSHIDMTRHHSWGIYREGERRSPFDEAAMYFNKNFGERAQAFWKWDQPMRELNSMVAYKSKAVGDFWGAADGMDVAFAPEANFGETAPDMAVRSNFADTAFWSGKVVTDAEGRATIKVKMPDSLTSWHVIAWAVGTRSAAGQGEGQVITAKQLMVRLEAPRFFVEKDEVVLSAVVNSRLATPQKVKVLLEQENGCFELKNAREAVVEVAPNGEKRVDWRTKVVQPGEALLRVKAFVVDNPRENDAMELRYPVLKHGMQKLVALSRTMERGQEDFSVQIEVPQEIEPGSARLELGWSPSLAMSMMEALPYLLDYPYGCTEQTLNRFLPAVIVRNVLTKQGFALEELSTNQKDAGEKGAWTRQHSGLAPVFDTAEMNKMVRAGVRRLQKMQCGDGGWGWFDGLYERSYPHTTAQVVRGLRLARENGVAVDDAIVERGIAWLEEHLKKQVEKIRTYKKSDDTEWRRKGKPRADNMDAFVYLVLAEAGKLNGEMAELLFEAKNELSVYGKCLFALGLAIAGDARMEAVKRNVMQYLVQDEENQTAYLDWNNSGYWWYWYGDRIEAQAVLLRLLVKAEPQGKVAPRLVKYILNNRKNGSYWNSTRDTALCIEALSEYALAVGENKPDQTVEVAVDGKQVANVHIDANNLFTAQLSAVLETLEPGKHTVTVKRAGEGMLFLNGYLSYYDRSEHIGKAGLELKVERNIYRLHREINQKETLDASGEIAKKQVEKYRREQLAEGALVKSGDLLEVELVIDSKNDYEYIFLEDYRASGSENAAVQSGYRYVGGLSVYMEYRDTHTAMMFRSLPRGRYSVTYRLRAEVPGTFSSLPTVISGMYAPELKGNAEEMRYIIGE